MQRKITVMLTVPALMFGLATIVPVFAQDNSSAGDSMHRAGQSAENAASETGQAVAHTYHGVATAVTDSTITARVKIALHDDKSLANGDIHVTTVGGVVTLKGDVPNGRAARRADRVASQTAGVQGVNNQLAVKSTM